MNREDWYCNGVIQPIGVIQPMSYKVTRCSNQFCWDTIHKIILYKKYNVSYGWSSLDEAVQVFNDNAYKDLTITFRDTVARVEKFIEHPSIFVISISQVPLEDVYGNLPTSDWPKGPYQVMKEDGTITKEKYDLNLVNSAFVRQEQRFFNETGPDLTPSNINKLGGIGSLIRNSMYDNKVRPEFADIINPDERMYNITSRISSEYFIVTHTMEYKLFDIIQSKFSRTNRTYLSCSQFLYDLDMLNAVEKSGYYWMKLKKLEKKPAHDFDWSILSQEIGRIAYDLIQNKNENLNSNFS